MLNRPLRIAVSLVALIVAAQRVSATQDDPEDLIMRRAVAASRKSEPDWRFTVASLTQPPLMDEQLGSAGGFWERLSDSSHVSVTVYGIATAAAAKRYMSQPAGAMPKGCTVVAYEAGDGARMSTCPDHYRGVTQYGMWIRKGLFLVSLNGRSQEAVERFARILVTAISN